ncbi:hypothetical protein NQ314_008275 [Rhamnusium bicolor]|uniref:Uncharacterized protein n=1 Tax=Rhamnusium bicolor TaxID=1586634 RepID=A0AAV8YF58_9CUCU|nr:hypothetical protein NQ314_008275 [Rhamnusium bicolor]
MTHQKTATRVEATTLKTKLQCLETAILLKVWGTILKRVNNVSMHLQKVELDLAEAVNLLKSLASFFLEIRKDFDGYERKGMELCGLTSYKIKRKQIRKLKTDEIRDNEEIYFNEPDKFRIHTFYAIIDKLTAEMDRRCQAYIGTLEKFDVLFHLNDVNVTELKEKRLTISKAFCHDIENDIIEELVHLQSFKKFKSWQ